MLVVRHLRINIQCACGFATEKLPRWRAKTKINQSKFSKNPGIQHQLQIFSKRNDVEKMKPEDINPEALEADFMKAEEMIDDYDRKLAAAISKQDFRIIQRKYFKPSPEPNMLTWAEKEQIRYLHNDNPSHWTPEQLSASFPATPGIIKKILKSSWKAANYQDIKRHDKRVATNWNEFVQGRLEISSPDLKEHVTKFTSRKNISSFSETDLKQITDNPVPKPKSSEFASIISSYKEITSPEQILPAIEENPKEKRLVLQSNTKSKAADKTLYSLEAFKEKAKAEVNTSKIVSEEDMLLLHEEKRNLVTNNYVAPSEIYCSDAVVTKGKLGQISLLNEESYPMRIFIPKNKRKVGALYKVNDCFYSSDGCFLYRVPGMSQEL